MTAVVPDVPTYAAIPQTRRSLSRAAGVSGLAFVALVAIENLLVGSASPPANDASAAEIAEFFTNNKSLVSAAVGIVPFAVVALYIFIAGVTERLRRGLAETLIWTRLGMTGLMTAAVALFIFRLVPEFLMRFLAWLLIHSVYRVDKQGLDNIPEEGACVLVCNHVSYVDAIVISACVRRPIRFVMDHRIFATPVLGFIFRTMRTIPIAPAKEDSALKERAFQLVREALANGEVVGIFPEGRLTGDGEIHRFRPGIERIVAETPVPVVPLALQGLWGSFFSRYGQGRAMRKLRGLFSRIALVAGPPVAPEHVDDEGLQATVLALRGERR